MNRSMARGGLRPIQLKPDVMRFTWLPRPAYRALVAVPVAVRPELLKKRSRPSGY
jgi:hypothetical protein